jgi:hypothetical protein
MERAETGLSGLGWGSQITGLAAVALFLFLVGGVAWAGSHLRATELASKLHDQGGAAAGEALRAKFLQAIAASLETAGVESTVDAEIGTLRLGPRSVSFKVGQAWLIGRPLEQIDTVGAVLAQATACLSKQPQGYAAPSVLDARPGLQACTAAEKISTKEFTCQPEFAALPLDAVLVEGHADARAYAVPGRQFKDNLNLSSARAETVLRRLYACTPALSGLANPQGHPLVALGAYSTQRPAQTSDPLSEANRRVEFRFVLGKPAPVVETEAVLAE